MNLKCYVIDDHLHAAEEIGKLINQTTGLELIGMETDDKTALKKLLNKEIIADIVFLDIELQTMHGVDFAEKIRNLTQVILVTGKNQYALEAYAHGIKAYLMKPVNYTQFLKSVDRIQAYLDLQKKALVKFKTIVIRVNRKMFFLNPEDIIYIESCSNYLKFFMKDGNMHMPYMAFNTFDEANNYPDLVRVHKSFVVNLNFIKSLDGNVLETTTGTKIQLGPTFRDLLLRMLDAK